MINRYIIREGGGDTTESTIQEVAHLIDQGKLKFTGKKSKWNAQAAELEMRRFYIRVNWAPRKSEPCTKPCCAQTKNMS